MAEIKSKFNVNSIDRQFLDEIDACGENMYKFSMEKFIDHLQKKQQ